jgi:uncharacterized membrane protein (DUF373 family)
VINLPVLGKFVYMAKKIQSFAQRLERLIIYSLIIMMAVVLIFATIELAYNIITTLIQPPFLLLDFEELLDLFGIFMLVLIGIELLDTIKIYFKRNVVHVEVVVLVAIIAVSRKIIVLEPTEYDPVSLIGIAFIILALAFSYFLLKRLGCEMISSSNRPKYSRKKITDEIKEIRKILSPGRVVADEPDTTDKIKDAGYDEEQDTE